MTQHTVPRANVRLTAALKRELDRWASEEGETVSVLVRRVLRQELARRRPDAGGSKRRRPIDPLPAEDQAQLDAYGRRPLDTADPTRANKAQHSLQETVFDDMA